MIRESQTHAPQVADIACEFGSILTDCFVFAAGPGVTWADDHAAEVADSPNTIRRVMVSDIRRMLLAPAGGLGGLIAQHRLEIAALPACSPGNCSVVSEHGEEGEESALEQSLRLELDEARVELMAGDRVELAGKAALAAVHRTHEKEQQQLQEAEERAQAAEEQCKGQFTGNLACDLFIIF